jgi:hypothetical protein
MLIINKELNNMKVNTKKNIKKISAEGIFINKETLTRLLKVRNIAISLVDGLLEGDYATVKEVHDLKNRLKYCGVYEDSLDDVLGFVPASYTDEDGDTRPLHYSDYVFKDDKRAFIEEQD